MKHEVRWHTASPVWDLALQDAGPAPARFEEPLLLRFQGDGFLDSVQAVLEADPARLAEYALRHETWETHAWDQAGWLSLAGRARQPIPKLYHPAHNRFYLVAASLVCRTRGLPDRTVDASAGERVSFVVRRLFPKSGVAQVNPNAPSTYEEYVWIGDRQHGKWLRANPAEQVAAGEERLPLSPLGFEQEKHPRRIHVGLVPVSSRELYEGGDEQVPSAELAGDPLADPRMAAFHGGVLAGLEQLKDLPGATGIPAAEADAAAREALLFVLLDFAEFLSRETPAVWAALAAPGPAPPAPANQLYSFLTTFAKIEGVSWAEMLANAEQHRAAILAGNYTTDLIVVQKSFTRSQIEAGASGLLTPDPAGEPFLVGYVESALGDPRAAQFADLLAEWFVPLAATPATVCDSAARERLLEALLALAGFFERELPDVWAAIAAGSAGSLSAEGRQLFDLLEANLLAGATWREILANAKKYEADIAAENYHRGIIVIENGVSREQAKAFAAALQASGISARVNAALSAPAVPSEPAPEGGETPDAYYVIRCVYERPQCKRAVPPVVSKPSPPFRLAAYFDPDAPVRDLRIRMPVDASYAGLKKFPKNVSVLISNELRKQMSRAQDAGLSGLMDGSVKEGSLPGLGVICSFSIPIITICALILLMIIVQLLNIVFWWLPLFKICLPLRLKAK